MEHGACLWACALNSQSAAFDISCYRLRGKQGADDTWADWTWITLQAETFAMCRAPNLHGGHVSAQSQTTSISAFDRTPKSRITSLVCSLSVVCLHPASALAVTAVGPTATMLLLSVRRPPCYCCRSDGHHVIAVGPTATMLLLSVRWPPCYCCRSDGHHARRAK